MYLNVDGLFVLPAPPLTAGMKEHPPIAISDLADNIERLRANDGLRFSQEYEVTLLASYLPVLLFGNDVCIYLRGGIRLYTCYFITVSIL